MIARSPRDVAKAGDNTRGDPPDNNGNDTEPSFLGNGSSGLRNVNEMV